MGKLYISLEDDLNLLDVIRAHVSQALEILLQSPKTKAEYAKSFASALQAVQNIKKLLTFSTQPSNEDSQKKEAHEEGKIEPTTSTQNATKMRASNPADPKPVKKQEAPRLPGNSAQICRSTVSEPIRKSAKTSENPKTASGAKTVIVLSNPVDGRTPGQKALTNPLIVQKIMENVTSRTLKGCRRVCSVWKEEATKQLLTPRHHRFLEVKLRWSENNGEYQHTCRGTLQSLMDFCLKTSRGFPCIQFNFDGGYLSSPAFLKFFTDFGAKLKFLQFNPSTNTDDESSLAVKNLSLVLFKLAPNLEGLTLNSMDWARGIDFPKEIKMPAKRKGRGFQKSTKNQQDLIQSAPNLKRLTLPLQRKSGFPAQFSEVIPVLVNILKSAPNLARIDDENLFFTREIVAAGKFGLVKDLQVYVDDSYPEREDRYLYFAEQGPRLETIEFVRDFFTFYGSDTARNCLTAILRSSKNTLKTVRGLHEVKLCSWEIPQLENVTRLKLKPKCPLNHGAIVPAGKNLVECFPNLIEITGDSRILENPANSSKCVHRIFLTMTNPSPKLMSDAESLYPNLKLISLDVVDIKAREFPETIKAICASFPGLEILRIFMTITVGWFWAPQMDSAFTGLPLSCCNDPGESQRENPDEKIIQSLKMNDQPSIRNLTKLQELQICIRQQVQDRRVSRLCTRISDLYAFDLMKKRQNLKVQETVQNWF